jgi:hypothetical protein
VVRVVKPEQDLPETDIATNLQSSPNTTTVSAPDKQRAETNPAIAADILEKERVIEKEKQRKAEESAAAIARNNEKQSQVNKTAGTKTESDKVQEQNNPEKSTASSTNTNNPAPVNMAPEKKSETEPKLTQNASVMADKNEKPSFVNTTPEKKTAQHTSQPVITKQPQTNPVAVTKKETIAVKDQAQINPANNNIQPGQEDAVRQVKASNDQTATATKDLRNAPASVAVKPDITLKAAVVEGRKSEFTQEVAFKGDSLQISIYDNGVVDGDTVSVFMNGEVLMSKQGLKSSAIKKTIYLTPGKDDEFTLVLFADNLGQYPPNTGLLVVRDGTDVYNLRFSADFQKNAGVIFRRKK